MDTELRLYERHEHLGQANILNQRRAAIATLVLTASVAITTLWIAMLTGSHVYRVPALVPIAQIFPAIGGLMCIVLLGRNRTLYREQGHHLFAAMLHERELWKHSPQEVRRSAGHVAAIDHVGLKGTTDPIRGAVFWPMMFFTGLLAINVYFGHLLNLSSGPT
jgi:hypothetical protein